MRELKSYGWVVESRWGKGKWTAEYVIDFGHGRYVLNETKKKAQEMAKIVKGCGKNIRIIKWQRRSR